MAPDPGSFRAWLACQQAAWGRVLTVLSVLALAGMWRDMRGWLLGHPIAVGLILIAVTVWPSIVWDLDRQAKKRSFDKEAGLSHDDDDPGSRDQ